MRYLKKIESSYIKFNENYEWFLEEDIENIKNKYPNIDSTKFMSVDLNNIFFTLVNVSATFRSSIIIDKYHDIKFETFVKKLFKGRIVIFKGDCECHSNHYGRVTLVDVNKYDDIDVPFPYEVKLKTTNTYHHPIDTRFVIDVYDPKNEVKDLMKKIDLKKNTAKFDL